MLATHSFCHMTVSTNRDAGKTTNKSLTLNEVYSKTLKTRAKWENIGIQLGLEDHDLAAIKKDHNSKTDDCYRELLKIWLRKGGATWEALAAALNHETVGFCDLANSLIVQTESSETKNRVMNLTKESSSQSEEGFKCRYCGNCTLEQ